MNAQQHPQTGTKHDAQKPKPALVLHSMSRAIQAVVEVATFGAGKYGPNNWLLVPDATNRYRDAKLRHMLDSSTETHDPESGLLHAAHEAWNALAVLELMLRGAQATPADWDAGEKRMEAIGRNGPTGEHYPGDGERSVPPHGW